MVGRGAVQSRKFLVRSLLGLVLVAVAIGFGAAPASAHAELLGTEPEAGATLDQPPKEVLLKFSETVEPPGDAVEVYGSDGDKLDVGDIRRPDGGHSVAVDLPDIDDGAYVVTWKVVSADSHPIRGGFTFRVGDAAAGSDAEADRLMERLLAGQGGDTSVGFVFGVVRFFGFAGMILLVGGTAFVATVWPAGAEDRRVRRLIAGGWRTVVVATLASFGLQGAYAAGDSLGGVFDTSNLGDVLDTRAGRIWLLRLVLLAVVALARRWLLPPVSTVAGAVAGLALLSTISFAGHAGSGDLVPLALVTDIAHLSAISFWLAGLTVLTVVLLRRPHRADASANAPADSDPEDAYVEALSPVVKGFSTWAAVAVAVIVVSGTIQGVRQTQGFEALGQTTYGRLLLLKVGFFLSMFGAAVFSRLWVQNRWTPPSVPEDEPAAAPVRVSAGPGAKAVGDDVVPASPRPTLRGLRLSVGIEMGLAVLVLAVTALLVNTVPGREAISPTFKSDLHATELLMRVNIDPAKAGPTDIRVETLTHGAQPLEVVELTGELSLPSRDIGPIPLELKPVAGKVGVYTAPDTDIPFAGTWRLDLSARLSEFDEASVAAEVPIK